MMRREVAPAARSVARLCLVAQRLQQRIARWRSTSTQSGAMRAGGVNHLPGTAARRRAGGIGADDPGTCPESSVSGVRLGARRPSPAADRGRPVNTGGRRARENAAPVRHSRGHRHRVSGNPRQQHAQPARCAACAPRLEEQCGCRRRRRGHRNQCRLTDSSGRHHAHQAHRSWRNLRARRPQIPYGDDAGGRIQQRRWPRV